MANKDGLKDIVSGGGATFITLIASYIIIFFYKLIIARHYGPDDYGLFEMTITILGFITVFGSLGFANGIGRFVPLYKIKSKKFLSGYIKTIILIQLVVSILISLILIIFANNITAFFNFPDVFTKILYVLAFIAPLHKFSGIFMNILIAHKKILIGKIGKEVIYNGVILIGSLFLFLFDLSIFKIILLLAFAHVVMFFYYLYFFIPLSKTFKSETKKYEIKRWISFSIPLLFAGIAGKFLGWTDNLVIGRMLTQSDLGVYGVTFSIAFYLFMGSMLFASIFLPIMTSYYEKDREEFKRLFTVIRNWTTLFSFVVGSVFILFAEQILLLLFGSDYTGGASSLRVLSAFFLLANYFYYSRHILQLQDKTNNILYGNLIGLVINLLLTIILVSKIGIIGAAIGSGFSNFLFRYIFYLMTRKYVKIGHDYKYILKSFILAFGSAFIAYFAANILLSGVSLGLIVYVLIAGAFYLSAMILGIRHLSILGEHDLVVFEFIEKYTKINLNWLKRILIK